MVAVISFAGFQFVEKYLIDSSSDFFGNFHLLLNVVSGYDSLLLKRFQRFKRNVKAVIDGSKLIVDVGFHGALSSNVRYTEHVNKSLCRLLTHGNS